MLSAAPALSSSGWPSRPPARLLKTSNIRSSAGVISACLAPLKIGNAKGRRARARQVLVVAAGAHHAGATC